MAYLDLYFMSSNSAISNAESYIKVMVEEIFKDEVCNLALLVI